MRGCDEDLLGEVVVLGGRADDAAPAPALGAVLLAGEAAWT